LLAYFYILAKYLVFRTSARPFTFMSFIPFQVWVPSEGTFASRCTYAFFAFLFVHSSRRSDYSQPTPAYISMYPLGGVFWRRGTPKSVEHGASYSEGYIRYPHGYRL